MVCLEVNAGAGEEVPVLRAVALDGEAGVGDDPEAVFAVQDHGTGAEGVQFPEDRQDGVLVRKVAVEGTVVGEEKLAAAGFQHGAEVLAGALDGNAVEMALVGGEGDAVHGDHAQAAVLQGDDVVDLVVGEAGLVVRAEELLELMADIAVEAAEGGHPDVALLVLCESVDALVGDGGGENDASFYGCGEVSTVIIARA